MSAYPSMDLARRREPSRSRRFIGLTARGACLPAAAGRGRGEQGIVVTQRPHFVRAHLAKSGSSHTQERKLNAARPRSSALLATASQARHAPRLAPLCPVPSPGQKVAITKPNCTPKQWQEIANLLAIPLGVLGLITDFRRESESGRIY